MFTNYTGKNWMFTASVNKRCFMTPSLTMALLTASRVRDGLLLTKTVDAWEDEKINSGKPQSEVKAVASKW